MSEIPNQEGHLLKRRDVLKKAVAVAAGILGSGIINPGHAEAQPKAQKTYKIEELEEHLTRFYDGYEEIKNDNHPNKVKILDRLGIVIMKNEAKLALAEKQANKFPDYSKIINHETDPEELSFFSKKNNFMRRAIESNDIPQDQREALTEKTNALTKALNTMTAKRIND